MTDRSKIKDNNPFMVPDNYFDEVKEDILNRTSGKISKNGKKNIVKLLKPALMLAAAMVAFAIISYTVLKLLFPEHDQAKELNYTEFLYHVDEVELIEKLTEQNGSYNSMFVDTDEIIIYLLEQDIEIESIVELLNQEI
ncbi:MAG TPA: hypothetical protein DEQ09_11345 [Bacteroidales bacterium]|nr:hypothetical protein [Bacteroidales bacterium]